MAPPPIERVGGRQLVRATRTQMPGVVAEPGARQLREFLPFLQVGFGAGRDVQQRRLGELAATRTRPTVELEALAGEILKAAGAKAGDEALARTAWRIVADR